MGEEEPLASPYFGHHSFLLALGNKEVDEICSLRKWKSGLVSSPARSPIMREGFTMLRDGDTCGTLMGWAPGCGGSGSQCVTHPQVAHRTVLSVLSP